MNQKQTLELDPGQLASSIRDQRNPIRNIYWLASYPKSGNTWMRLLLQAWYTGGKLDNLNKSTIVKSDIDECAYQSVLAAPLPYYTDTQMALIRTAALFQMSTTCQHDRCILKTHHARVKVHEVELCPGFISSGAVYVVRDPRDVAVSLAAHINKSVDDTIELMANDQATIGFDPMFNKTSPIGHVMCSWSTHVRSWLTAKRMEVRVIRYEDLFTTEGARKQLGYMLELLKLEDEDTHRVSAAIEACEFDHLQALEDVHGFHEKTPWSRFFRVGKAGQWKMQLTPAQVQRIQDDHGELMTELGYELE